METNHLTKYDHDRLDAASKGLGDFGYEPAAVRRFHFYCRKGYSVADSVAYALAWAANAVEQAARRVGHDTGAEGWRRKPYWEQ